MPADLNLTQDEWLAEFAHTEQQLETILQRQQKASLPLDFSSKTEVARLIDHTLLKLDATEEQVDELCEEAVKYGFKTVCIRLPFVARCVSNLHNRTPTVGIACVIGFHEGTHPTADKVAEAQAAVAAGATELDMVLNHILLRQQQYPAVYADILAVRQATGGATILKLILETALLDRQQLIAGSILALKAGADFIKTSTGFVKEGGATVADVRLMRDVIGYVGGGGKVKASGGIRTLENLREMVEGGAERVGCSASVGIVGEVGGEGDGVGRSGEERGKGRGY